MKMVIFIRRVETYMYYNKNYKINSKGMPNLLDIDLYTKYQIMKGRLDCAQYLDNLYQSWYIECTEDIYSYRLLSFLIANLIMFQKINPRTPADIPSLYQQLRNVLLTLQ